MASEKSTVFTREQAIKEYALLTAKTITNGASQKEAFYALTEEERSRLFDLGTKIGVTKTDEIERNLKEYHRRTVEEFFFTEHEIETTNTSPPTELLEEYESKPFLNIWLATIRDLEVYRVQSIENFGQAPTEEMARLRAKYGDEVADRLDRNAALVDRLEEEQEPNTPSSYASSTEFDISRGMPARRDQNGDDTPTFPVLSRELGSEDFAPYTIDNTHMHPSRNDIVLFEEKPAIRRVDSQDDISIDYGKGAKKQKDEAQNSADIQRDLKLLKAGRKPTAGLRLAPLRHRPSPVVVTDEEEKGQGTSNYRHHGQLEPLSPEVRNKAEEAASTALTPPLKPKKKAGRPEHGNHLLPPLVHDRWSGQQMSPWGPSTPPALSISDRRRKNSSDAEERSPTFLSGPSANKHKGKDGKDNQRTHE